jgi:hypothetical protein
MTARLDDHRGVTRQLLQHPWPSGARTEEVIYRRFTGNRRSAGNGPLADF